RRRHSRRRLAVQLRRTPAAFASSPGRAASANAGGIRVVAWPRSFGERRRHSGRRLAVHRRRTPAAFASSPGRAPSANARGGETRRRHPWLDGPVGDGLAFPRSLSDAAFATKLAEPFEE